MNDMTNNDVPDIPDYAPPPPLSPATGAALLAVWVIYAHPADQPDHFVVRSQAVTRGGLTVHGEMRLAATMEAAREFVPPWLMPLSPDPSDHPTIAEVYL